MQDETITITIKMGNDAMQDDTDLAYVLRCLADRIEGKGRNVISKVFDINGNTVGTVQSIQ